jgi:hypothetical protein
MPPLLPDSKLSDIISQNRSSFDKGYRPPQAWCIAPGRFFCHNGVIIFNVLLDNPEVSRMRLGIVGLPNVGKSTLFNAITRAGAAVANYPFCTIEPNVGVVAVPDKRLDVLSGTD